MDYYSNALNLFKLLDNKEGISQTQNNIGMIYNNEGDYDKAMEYFQKNYIRLSKVINK